MRVFVTKYALTAGIEVKEVEYGSGGENYVYTQFGLGLQQFVMGKTAFLTYPEAAAAAREMRDRKVTSIKKQLARVSGLIFPMRMPDDFRTEPNPNPGD